MKRTTWLASGGGRRCCSRTLTATGVMVAPVGGRRLLELIDHQVRHAPLALRQGPRHRRHRQGRHQLHDQHRLRRRPGLLGPPRPRPGDGRRGQGHDRLVQRPGRHQRAQDRRRLLRRGGHQRRERDDPGLQEGLHARRRGIRARRRRRAEPGSAATWPPFPGFTVSPVVANAYEMYQASPNPANSQPGVERLRGDEALREGQDPEAAGEYNSTLSTQQASMAKAVQAYTATGWKFVRTARSRSTTTARPTTRRSCRSSRVAASRSSTTTPRRARPSTAPCRRRTRSATTRSGSRTPAPTLRPSPSGTPPGWATTSTSACPTSRSRRPRSSPPSPSTSPS